MESLFQRFPHIIDMVLDKLDDKNLVNYKAASREMSEFLLKERFYWIRIIKRYSAYFGSFQNSWRQVINKTPVEIIKQLAVEVQEVFARCSDIFTEFPVISSQIVFIRDIAPLHIAAEQGNLKLCEHILEKTEDKNPKGHMKMKIGQYKVVDALTPLAIAILKGHFEIFSLIMNQISVKKFDLDLDSETPLGCPGRTF